MAASWTFNAVIKGDIRMRDYDIKNIEGAHEEFSVSITSEMMDGFMQITGDKNPLHCEEKFAKEKGYKDIVAYGLLTNSFLSTLCVILWRC